MYNNNEFDMTKDFHRKNIKTKMFEMLSQKNYE